MINSEFAKRHIGPNDQEVQHMLRTLGHSSMEDFLKEVIPSQIRSQHSFERLGEGLSEYAALQRLSNLMNQNQVFRSHLGMGYYDTVTPSVIRRMILENPNWYTAYTPYQPEISQGRMEALLNFQTMVCDLTGMEIANASLLDEGTAAAEAASMAHNLCKNKSSVFLASPDLHPHVLEVLQTRAEPLGWKMIVGEWSDLPSGTSVFAWITAYPGTEGNVDFSLQKYTSTTRAVQAQGGLVIVDTDLLSLTVLQPPGEWGADIVVGNSQRFGVPLGNGGPHAAFLATRDSFKRLLPGRLVGVSVDADGKRALRLTLQTREQHIRREKATSNICTAQVLLANMAAMYAVYHGPEGLREIASRVHRLTQILAKGLERLGFALLSPEYFDTLSVVTGSQTETILTQGVKHKRNYRRVTDPSSASTHQRLAISLDETSSESDVGEILLTFCTDEKQKDALKSFLRDEIWKQTKLLPQWKDTPAHRKSAYLTHPVFHSHRSETQMMRYLQSLSDKDITLTQSMIPLGSCTMKLNSAAELTPVSWPTVNGIHPFAPTAQMVGMVEMIKDLEELLCDITGFARVTLQPNAGSQGEYAGLLVIRSYHLSRGDSQRNVCLIPSSAHGTNPATAIMAGMEVVVVKCDQQGNVDIADLRSKAEMHSQRLAALMITYPSTHGVFEEGIREICEVVHSHGGQVYMDGANLNALVGLCRPGEFGPDVSHMNLHKTFAIPHGGGGPGVGPIGVAKHLADFLPSHRLKPECGPSKGGTAVASAPWGSASILPIPWSYIVMMGRQGLRHASAVAILSANYLAHRLEPHYPVLYKGKNGRVAHECILDLRHFKNSCDVDVNDVAKRLMDFGFHAPTMSWPVAGTFMIEPTESESLSELDRFADAMIAIRKEIARVESQEWKVESSPLRQAPHSLSMITQEEWKLPYPRTLAAFPLSYLQQRKFWPAVRRIDNAYGDRNIMCSCPPLEEEKPELRPNFDDTKRPHAGAP